jgi:protoheme IX farnesyltransferase
VKRILGYTVVMVAATVVPFATGTFGVLYLVAALALGGLFVALSVQLLRTPTRKAAAGLFHYSLLYLALLFVAAALDPLL